MQVYSTDRDLYWIADAVFINIRRENENKTLDLQKFSALIILRNGTDTFFAGVHITVGDSNPWILQSNLQINWVLYE